MALSSLFSKKKASIFAPVLAPAKPAATQIFGPIAKDYQAPSAAPPPIATPAKLFSTAPVTSTGAGSTALKSAPVAMTPTKLLPPNMVNDYDRSTLLYGILPDHVASSGTKDQIIDAVLAEGDRLSSQGFSKQVPLNEDEAKAQGYSLADAWMGRIPKKTVTMGPVEQAVRKGITDIATGPVTSILRAPELVGGDSRKGAVNMLNMPEIKLQRIQQFLQKYAPDEVPGFQQRQKVQGMNSGSQVAGDVVEFGMEAATVSGNVRPLVSGLPVIKNLEAAGGASWYGAQILKNAAANMATYLTLGVTKEQDKTRVMKNIIADPAMLFPYARKWEMVAAPMANYLASRAVGLSKEEALMNSVAGGVSGVTGYMSNQAGFALNEQQRGIKALGDLASQKAEQIRTFAQAHPDQFDEIQSMQDQAIKDLEKEHRLIFKSGGKEGTPGIDYPATPQEVSAHYADLTAAQENSPLNSFNKEDFTDTTTLANTAKTLGTTTDKLREVVKSAGSDLDNIEAALQKNFGPAYKDMMDKVQAGIDSGDLPIGAADVADPLRKAVFGRTVNGVAPIGDGLPPPPVEPPTMDASVEPSPDTSGYLESVKSAQKQARIGAKPSFAGKVSNFFGKLKADLIDSNAPIEDALHAAEKENGFVILPKHDITNQIDRVLRAPTLANQFMKDNGLIDIIRTVDSTDDLDQVLIAQQGIDVYNRAVQAGSDLSYPDLVGKSRSLEGDMALLKELGPKYVDQITQVRDYSEKALDMMSTPIKDGGYGLISEDTAQVLREKYPNYVPLNRIFSDTEEPTGFFNPKSVANLSDQTVVQKLRGSKREIESPMFNLMSKTYDLFSQGERNKAASMIASYSELPGFSDLVREMQPGEKAPFKITFLDDGTPREFETTKDIAEAAKNLKAQQVGILGKIFIQTPTRIFKAGTTGLNLPFVGANVVRDQVTAFVNSDEALSTSIANPKVFVQSLMEAANHGDLTDQMIRDAATGTSFDAYRNQPEESFKEIRSFRNPVSRAAYVATHPGELLRSVENILSRGEELTRTQQYLGTKEAMMSQGMNEQNASIEAAIAYRQNTADFLRKGNFGGVLNSTIPYFNAGIQGSRTFVRSLARAPAETAAKAAIAVFFPVAVTTAWNMMDPLRKAAYDDIQDWEKKGAMVIVPPNPTQDEQGRWNVIKIPLPPGLGDFASLVRRPLEALQGGDPVSFMDVASSLVGGISPLNIESPGKLMSGLTPQVIRPSIEAITNQNLFTGAPQVSDQMKNLPPALQVRPGTSGTVKLLAGPANASPIKVQSFLKGTFGGISDHLLNLSDNVLAKFGYIKPEDVGGQNVVEAMSARFSKAAGQNNRNDLYNAFNDILSEQDADRLAVKDKAEMWIEQNKSTAKFMQKSKLNQLKKSDEQLYNKIKDLQDQAAKGLSEEDRLIMQLGVTNGYRAQYIKAKTAKMTDDEKDSYIGDLMDKKVISADVAKQLGVKTGLFSTRKKTFKSSLFGA